MKWLNTVDKISSIFLILKFVCVYGVCVYVLIMEIRITSTINCCG